MIVETVCSRSPFVIVGGVDCHPALNPRHVQHDCFCSAVLKGIEPRHCPMSGFQRSSSENLTLVILLVSFIPDKYSGQRIRIS